GDYAYIGHIPNPQRIGTSILDVSDPRKPRIAALIEIDDPESHSHKVRAIGNIMIVNHERNTSAIGRRADELPRVRLALREKLGRDPNPVELAEKLGVKQTDLALAEAAARNPYANGGFKIYDVSDRTKPELIAYHKTGGIGVHRFDMDEKFAYISTEMPGYVGNILVIYDIGNPARPEEVSRWSMPGQHAAAGETPNPQGRRHRLHHALRFGDELWASCWFAGVRVIGVSDIRAPRTLGEYN
ncbi:MAG: RNA polymerase subunit sigma-70, partial [Betaproteobacteria bacterium]|nr:RNA polymerase subunit sigma-70 [Betaproteobacteria bacterium]